MIGNSRRDAPGQCPLVLLLGLLGLASAACASVETIRLTNQVFPPKQSVHEVETLSREPTRQNIPLAELRISDTWMGFDRMQQKILAKAAALGSDAVVFSKPDSHVEHQVAYEPVYSPWGYYSPYYGPGSWGIRRTGIWRLELRRTVWPRGVGLGRLRQLRGRSVRRDRERAQGNRHPVHLFRTALRRIVLRVARRL
jgi:hypothetical protein